MPNLSLLPAGPTPPNPAELLSSARSPILLARAREAATFVILDAPPISAIADALALATIVDGVLLVVRAGKTRRPAAQRAKDQLERVGANILGVVLTDPKSAAVEAAAREAGYLVNAAAPDVIRLAPPLILTEDQADGFVAALPAILDTAQQEGAS